MSGSGSIRDFIAKRYFAIGVVVEGERKMDIPVPDFQSTVSLEYKIATAEDLHRLPGWDLPKRHLRILAKMMARGDVCIVALHNGAVAGHGFARFADAYDPRSGVTTKIGPDEAYIYDLYVEKNMRSRNVGQALICEQLRYLRDRGIKKVRGTIRGNDRLMWLIHTRMFKFVPIRVHHFVRLWKLVFSTGSHPWTNADKQRFITKK